MNLKRVIDVAKEDQTDELKLLIYRQIEQFVYKYQSRYYPYYKGDKKELVYDIFEEFIRPKKHRDGSVYSELDRLDPSIVGKGEWTGDTAKAIATYTQRFVTHTLIDKARTDHHEVTASENYDEEHGGLTIDRAAKGTDDGMVAGAYIENMNYKFHDLMDNPEALKKAKRELLANPKQVKYIQSLIKHYGDKLDPEVLEFAEKFVGTEEEPAKLEIPNIEGATTVSYKLQGKPAVKVSFPSKEELEAADKSAIDHKMAEAGYKFYKTNGNNHYYFLGDSKITDALDEAKVQEALDGGDTYSNVDYQPGGYMSSPDKLFDTFARKHPTGFVVIKSKGDTSVGADAERRDGRVWTLANKYTVKNKDKSVTFDIACLSNEGWDPSNKTGWVERNGKKWYVGKSFGWFLNGQKNDFKTIKELVLNKLNTEFN